MSITFILKRGGRKQKYDRGKITMAIWKSLFAVTKTSGKFAKLPTAAAQLVVSETQLDKRSPEWQEAVRLAKIVEQILIKSNGSHRWQVEEIQDVVEQVLLAAGRQDAAEAYILYRNRRSATRFPSSFGLRPSALDDNLGMSENAYAAMAKRYLWKDKEGDVIETPKGAIARVATAVASSEIQKKSQIQNLKSQKNWRDKFLEIMTSFEFVPGGCYFRGAGNKQNGSLANCFVLPVEDSIEKIFDAVKWAALIHQMGGGCISGTAKVFTTFCGLENFEVLYDRLGGRSYEIKAVANGWKINVADQNIFTLAFDSESGAFAKDKILDIWRYELPKERVYSVHASGGLKITTSDWHPFFVFEGSRLVEKRADKIQVGDLLISGNSTILRNWPFRTYQLVDDIKINEEIGWLVGYIIGDGSFGKVKTSSKRTGGRYDRLRIFDGRIESLKKAAEILKKLTGESLKIYKDSRCQTYILTCVNQKIVKFLQGVTNIVGPKGQLLHIPSVVIKSPAGVVIAMLAGLLDSDGHVTKSKLRVEFDTESQELSDQIVSTLSLLGIHGAFRKKRPQKSNWKDMFQVRIDGRQQIRKFTQLVAPYLADEFKKNRLLEHSKKSGRLKNLASPLRLNDLKPYLEKAGINISSTSIHKQAIRVGNRHFWLHRLKWGKSISIAKMIELLSTMRKMSVYSSEDKHQLENWQSFHESVVPVVRITKSGKGGDFYDFTTERYHNYLAGHHGLAVVHNTGFNFSHLRPRGDVVKSGGLASGPINFMKAFDAETQIVMQGGVHRGANMGILNVDHPDIFQFIRAKSVDGEISNFNISVGAFDGFMRAVKAGKDWALVNPRDKTTVQKIPARGLWDEMVNLAHSTGDPGMIYLDAVNRANPVLKTLGPIESTNVCVTGSTLIQTDQGNVTIENIVKNRLNVKVQTGRGLFENVTGFWDKGKKQVFELSSQQGLKIKATSDHRFLTPAGFIELSKLQVGGLVVIYQLGKPIEDVIISIKSTGEEQVFDLTVEPGHQIVTNGFVTHNCGEQPLHPFDVCNLGSINLSKFVIKPFWENFGKLGKLGKPVNQTVRRPENQNFRSSDSPNLRRSGPPSIQSFLENIKWERLEEVARTAVRFLDNGIDASTYPIPQIADMAHRLRRIGLGVMGWADMLVKLGVRYDSDEGIKLAELIMKFIQEISWDESHRLAKEKGEFPLWKGSYFKTKVRNVAVTTIAPTGTISMVADCSSGIEPYFALEYTKNVVEKKGLKYANKYYEEAKRVMERWQDGKDGKDGYRADNTLNTLNHSTILSSIFRTSHQISPDWHVKMQAAFQKYTDNAVSKTINFPGDATITDIEKAYMLAWELGCKGITVYRDGSREGQVLQIQNTEYRILNKKQKNQRPRIQNSEFPARSGYAAPARIAYGKAVAGGGVAGGRIQNSQKLAQSQMKITPLSQRAYQVERRKITEDLADGHCPECGAAMTSESGCSTCYSCGYSKCSL